MAKTLETKKHIFVLGKGYGEPVAYEVRTRTDLFDRGSVVVFCDDNRDNLGAFSRLVSMARFCENGERFSRARVGLVFLPALSACVCRVP